MARKGWYMICYDISQPKRLGRLHRLMKKKGIPVQKSVFFVHRREPDLKTLLKEIGKIIKPAEDDIRAYPVESPEKVWTTGGILESFPLIMPGANKRPSQSIKKSGAKSLWRKITGR